MRLPATKPGASPLTSSDMSFPPLLGIKRNERQSGSLQEAARRRCFPPHTAPDLTSHVFSTHGWCPSVQSVSQHEGK
jgi:hypothetical protein